MENFRYRQDWDLGDIVTVQYTKLSITTNQRVTEVEEVYENGTATITPTFGTPMPETLNLEESKWHRKADFYIKQRRPKIWI